MKGPVLCLFMMQGIVKHAPTEIGLDFHCRLRVLLFLIVSTFLIITLSIFSAFFLHRHLCSRRHSFFPVGV